VPARLSPSSQPRPDPRSRRDLHEVVRGLVADGATVLLTTQYLEEADALADRVALPWNDSAC
jgi:ABC-type multidrug transport system ATPase subunit